MTDSMESSTYELITQENHESQTTPHAVYALAHNCIQERNKITTSNTNTQAMTLGALKEMRLSEKMKGLKINSNKSYRCTLSSGWAQEWVPEIPAATVLTFFLLRIFSLLFSLLDLLWYCGAVTSPKAIINQTRQDQTDNLTEKWCLSIQYL